MNVALTLHNVIQNREQILTHNIKAIAPRLDVTRRGNSLTFTGWALQDEINEVMECVGQYHGGDHELHTHW